MIQIDIDMPKRCAECPCYGDRLYGKCQVTGEWLEDNEGSWFANERPKWCPLKEIDIPSAGEIAEEIVNCIGERKK